MGIDLYDREERGGLGYEGYRERKSLHRKQGGREVCENKYNVRDSSTNAVFRISRSAFAVLFSTENADGMR